MMYVTPYTGILHSSGVEISKGNVKGCPVIRGGGVGVEGGGQYSGMLGLTPVTVVVLLFLDYCPVDARSVVWLFLNLFFLSIEDKGRGGAP